MFFRPVVCYHSIGWQKMSYKNNVYWLQNFSLFRNRSWSQLNQLLLWWVLWVLVYRNNCSRIVSTRWRYQHPCSAFQVTRVWGKIQYNWRLWNEFMVLVIVVSILYITSIDGLYIRLIPKWRPINYSFVCMLINPLCLIFTSKFFCFLHTMSRQRGLINMQTKE